MVVPGLILSRWPGASGGASVSAATVTDKIDYDEQAARYARNRQIHPGVLAKLLEVGGLGPESRVLKVGCGTGNYISAIQERIGCLCSEIDHFLRCA